MTIRCLLKCRNGNRRQLIERSKRNPWPPPWSGGVIRCTELRPSPWRGFNFFGLVEHLVPPWPPPTQPLSPTYQSKFGLVFTIDGVYIDLNLVVAVHKIAWSGMIKSVTHVPSISNELDGIQGKFTRIFIGVEIPEGSTLRVTFVAVVTKENIMVVLLWCIQHTGCNPRKSASATTETEVSHLLNSFAELLDWHLTTIELLVSKRSQEVCCLLGALELQVSVLFWLPARNINPPKFEVQVLKFLSRVLVGSLSEKYSALHMSIFLTISIMLSCGVQFLSRIYINNGILVALAKLVDCYLQLLCIGLGTSRMLRRGDC
uniref:Uncharacterized protein n=1 Tax=Oryza punctata TaxID=4537 RepID=A0A0E0K4Q1_ORYPU